MARKKYRDIVIDGENWAWMFNAALDSDGDPYGTQTLKIWRNKKLVLEKYFYYDRDKKRYRIKPSLIARFIKTYLKK